MLFLATINTKVEIKEVQLVEQERKVLENVGRVLKENVVKDLVCYEFDDPSSDRFFLVGDN